MLFYFISSGLEFWSVKHNLIYEKSDSKVFENSKFLVEKTNNRLNDLFETNS